MAMTPESGNVMSMTEATAPQSVAPPPPPPSSSSSSRAQPKKRSRPSAGRPKKLPAQRKSSSGRRLQPSQRVLENQSMENDDTIASVEPDSAPASSLPGSSLPEPSLPGPSQVIADEAQINPPPNVDKERQGTQATSAVKPLKISPNISDKEHLQRVAASLFVRACEVLQHRSDMRGRGTPMRRRTVAMTRLPVYVPLIPGPPQWRTVCPTRRSYFILNPLLGHFLLQCSVYLGTRGGGIVGEITPQLASDP